MQRGTLLSCYKTARLACLAGLTLLAVGCATREPAFYWGHYEGLVYDMYFEPGSADTTTQILTLQADVEKSHAKGLTIAPGVHAHLGYLYAMQGNMAQAKAELVMEKTLFPEATVMVDGMLSRLQGGAQ
ncbi:DUF4810 domain-containing protein [Marinomonas ostreistagni]|uniref:DUF4810 domain-containing protein n=1 Tax=Marinomonas ostreistagni TaxID=359209 RepID=UPI00194FADF0|nr:DUF4810 domain-containing protein [Marinomonas ostreistagni]MBM6550750.1 DUF4810 domain-containing protein [Marinomonas ostreistagni]